MSYILDALRRAQAERERGQVPGLHAQPGLGGTARPPASTGAVARVPGWVWALGGAALVLAMLVPAVLLTRGADRAAGAAVPADTSRGAAQPALASANSATTAAATTSTNAAAPVPAVAPAPTAAAPVAEAPPPLVVVSAAPAVPKATAPTAVAQPASTATTRLPTPPAAAPSGPAGITPSPQAVAAGGPATAQPPAPSATTPAVSNAAPANAAAVTAANTTSLPPTLTAEQRREWPALTVGGSVWSDTPSARFVILGGQVVHEGQSSPEGVLVERITPKAVVLRWRDQRASLPL